MINIAERPAKAEDSSSADDVNACPQADRVSRGRCGRHC